jgi:uncharacterized protein YycO
MHKRRLYFLSCSVFIFCICFFIACSFTEKTSSFQNGDIIFQTSQSKQCTAVRIATRSIYSHCGIIYIENNKVYVYEAVGPVKLTPFNEWIQHGKDSKYVVKRLKDANISLTPAIFSKVKASGEKYKGKSYDIYFGWSDDKIYCSELVWKVYKQGANIEVGKLQKLKEFDLSSKEVQTILKERYGDNIPSEEIVISPQSIFESELLETVKNTY